MEEIRCQVAFLITNVATKKMNEFLTWKFVSILPIVSTIPICFHFISIMMINYDNFPPQNSDFWGAIFGRATLQVDKWNEKSTTKRFSRLRFCLWTSRPESPVLWKTSFNKMYQLTWSKCWCVVGNNISVPCLSDGAKAGIVIAPAFLCAKVCDL